MATVDVLFPICSVHYKNNIHALKCADVYYFQSENPKNM